MKKLLFLFFTLSQLIINAQAPHIDWLKGAGGTNFDQGNCVALDSSGNSYVGGFYNSASISFGNYTFTKPSAYISAPFIVKYDYFGNVVWAKTGLNAGGQVRSITTDNAGNIYVTGYFEDTINFDGTTLINNGTADIFVVKYNNSGTLIWARSFGGTLSEIGNDIAVDALGNIYVTGYYQSSTIYFNGDSLVNSGAADFFLVKYDSLGNEIWIKGAKGTPSTDDTGDKIALDPNGNIFVSGYYYSDSLTIGGIVLSNIPGTFKYLFIVKYDSGGNLTWSAYNSVGSDDRIENIAVDSSGNIYAVGEFQNTTFSFGGHNFVNTSTNGNTMDIFVMKFDPSGNPLWSSSKGYTTPLKFLFGMDICIDFEQNVLIGGSYYADIPMSFGSTTLPVTTGGYADFMILKYDNIGNEIWAQTHPTIANEKAFSIAVYKDGSIYLTGFQGVDPVSYNVFVCKTLPSFVPVWPGDTDNNLVVNNYDLLPIGLTYSEVGIPRTIMGNLWQADTAIDWGNVTPGYIYDKKHSDCNGDGIINNNDTLAINLNFSQSHTRTVHTQEAQFGANLYFVTSNTTYNPGDIVDVEIWLGSSTYTVYSLYGVAFDIQYDASLVQPGTESLSYQGNWLGNAGVNAITFSRIDPSVSTVYGAVCRTSHNPVMNGFGKIANFTFRVKNYIAASSVFNISFSDYKAVREDGSSVPFTPISDSLLFNSGSSSVDIEENKNSATHIAPNPFINETTLTLNQECKNGSVKIFDILGKEIRTTTFSGNQIIIEREDLPKGMYFIKIIAESKVIANEKIIIQ